MSKLDWYEIESESDDYKRKNIKKFSVNGVPYPLDKYLRITGQMTTDDAVELLGKQSKDLGMKINSIQHDVIRSVIDEGYSLDQIRLCVFNSEPYRFMIRDYKDNILRDIQIVFSL